MRFDRTLGDGALEVRLKKSLRTKIVVHTLLKKAKCAPAIALCAIHSDVGRVKQAFCIGTVHMAGRNPNTGAELDPPFADQDRFSDGAQHFARQFLRSVQVRLLIHIALYEHRKLVASQARHQAVVPYDLFETSRDLAQHRIAERLALQVIDLLELVQAHEQHPKRCCIRLRTGKDSLQLRREYPSVRQSGESIVSRQRMRLLLRRPSSLMSTFQRQCIGAEDLKGFRHCTDLICALKLRYSDVAASGGKLRESLRNGFERTRDLGADPAQEPY